MMITNASSKTITLINRKTIAPKKTVMVDTRNNPDLQEQIDGLIEAGLLNIEP